MTEKRHKLLLFTYYFPPCGAVAVYRMLAFAGHLPEFGWDVVVVAPPGVAHEPLDPELLKKVHPHTKVVSVPFPKNLRSRLIGRFFPLETWLENAWDAGAKAIQEHQPDVILTSSPPGCVHYLGYRAKKRFGIPWVACFRDPWITNAEKYRRSWLRRFLDQRGERRTLHHADLVLANTPLNLEGFRRVYPQQKDRILCVPNGFDPDPSLDFPQPPQAGSTIQLLHAGELYWNRDPRPLLDALRDLRVNPVTGAPTLRMEFLGRVTQEGLDLHQEIHRRGLQDIVLWRDQVPYQTAREAMKAADILVVVFTPGNRIGVPAKVYEYLGFGKPVLALAEPGGDIDLVLASTGITYRVVPATDAGAIRQALLELALEVSQGSAQPPDPARLQKYYRREIMRSLADRLDALVSPAKVTVAPSASAS